MLRCDRCGLPVTYETLEIGDDGICNICKNTAIIATVDWKEKKKQLDALVESYRGKHPFDCVIPFSGGKDSTFQLWYMVKEYGVKPLVVQYNHGLFRPGLLENNERTFRKLGVEVLSYRANWKLVKRTMVEALIRRGDWCWSCHAGCFAFPMQAAIRFETPLVIYGEASSLHTAYYEPGQVEECDENRFDMFTNLGISADDMRGMIARDSNFDPRDLDVFKFPKKADLARVGVRAICLGSYLPWDAQRQTEVIKRELGWQEADVEGVPPRYGFTKLECHYQGVRDWLKYLKRGYGRVTQMTAFDRRNDVMDKSQAEILIEQYEGKRPASLDAFLEMIDMTEDEFNECVRRTVVPPHVPDFDRPLGVPNKDAACSPRE